jgi:hypothetical protein
MKVEATKNFDVACMPSFYEGGIYEIEDGLAQELMSRGLVVEVKKVEKVSTKSKKA